MELETRRLLIRAFAPDDAEGLQAILGDAEVMEHCEPAYCLEKTRRFLTEFCIAKQGAVAAVEKKAAGWSDIFCFAPLKRASMRSAGSFGGMSGVRGTRTRPVGR